MVNWGSTEDCVGVWVTLLKSPTCLVQTFQPFIVGGVVLGCN